MFVQFMSPLGFLCLGPLIERWTFIRHDNVECKEVIVWRLLWLLYINVVLYVVFTDCVLIILYEYVIQGGT